MTTSFSFLLHILDFKVCEMDNVFWKFYLNTHPQILTSRKANHLY